MSSGPKVDLPNTRELLKIFTEIKTTLSTLELRDKANNTFHKVAHFLKMAGMYIPDPKRWVPTG